MGRIEKFSDSVAASVLAIAGVLRLYRAGQHDLWLDEALSYHFVTSRSLQDVLFSLPLTDPHPPSTTWSCMDGHRSPGGQN